MHPPLRSNRLTGTAARFPVPFDNNRATEWLARALIIALELAFCNKQPSLLEDQNRHHKPHVRLSKRLRRAPRLRNYSDAAERHRAVRHCIEWINSKHVRHSRRT